MTVTPVRKETETKLTGTLYVEHKTLNYAELNNGVVIEVVREGIESITWLLFRHENGKWSRKYLLENAPKWMRELYKRIG